MNEGLAMTAPDDGRLFRLVGVADGSLYTTLRETLLSLGWREWREPTPRHPRPGLLWTMRDAAVDFAALDEGQSANHFPNINAVVTKDGLQRCLRDHLGWCSVLRSHEVSDSLDPEK